MGKHLGEIATIDPAAALRAADEVFGLVLKHSLKAKRDGSDNWSPFALTLFKGFHGLTKWYFCVTV
jgi:hypothetical protein